MAGADIRLTARTDLQDVTEPFIDANRQVTLIGFSGQAGVTFFSRQGLPAKLPLGYSPVTGFELRGATGTGTIELQGQGLPNLGTDTSLLFLKQETASWRVIERFVASGTTLDQQFSGLDNGVYVVAIRDDTVSGNLPEVDEFLTNATEYIIPYALIANAVTIPERVNIIEEPNTEFILTVNADSSLPSGAVARVICQEEHQRFTDTIQVPHYNLDLLCYRYGITNAGGLDKLIGRLNVKCRGEISLSLTKHAQIRFSPAEKPPASGFVRFHDTTQLGALNFDFSSSSATGNAVRVTALPNEEPALAFGAESILTFELEVGGMLDQSPQLQLVHDPSEAMILLRHVEGGMWAYVGALTFDGSIWNNDPLNSDMRDTGTYAVVALDKPLCEIRGVVGFGGQVVDDVRLSTDDHPWVGFSGSTGAGGAYRFPMFQDSPSLTVYAFDPATRRSGSLEFPALAGLTLLTGQDIALGPGDFRLVYHEPAEGQPFVSLNPNILLEFSDQVTTDQNLIETYIVLTSGQGNTIPLHVLVEPGRTRIRILPLLTLAQDAQYTLTIDQQLPSLYGHPLDQTTTIQFTTLTHAVAGDVDLTRFYMRWENEQMFLEAPVSAAPERTVIKAFNRDKAYALTETMTALPFQRQVEAEPGDVLELEAILPNGRVVTHDVSVVHTGTNTLKMGHGGFSLEIEPGVDLRVDRVSSGFQKEVQIVKEELSTVPATLAQIPDIDQAPPLTPLYSVRLEPIDGTMPDFEGRIEIPFDIDTSPDQTLYAIRISSGIMAPLDPLNPQELASTTLANITDSVIIRDHEIISKTNQKTSLTSIGLGLSIGFPIEMSMARITICGAPNCVEIPVSAIVRCMRKPNDTFPQWEFDTPSWRSNPGYAGFDPAPSMPIYWLRTTPEGGRSYRFMGFADSTGEFSGEWFGDLRQFRALDHFTGELVFVSGESYNETRDALGFTIGVQFTGNAKADPDKVERDPNEPIGPKIQVKWEIVDHQNGSCVLNETQTSLLTRFKKFELVPDRSLRATVFTNFPMDSVHASGSFFTSFDSLPQESANRTTVVFPKDVPSTPPKISIDLEIQHENGETFSISEEFWAFFDLAAGAPVVGPPSVMGSSPRDKDKNVAPNDLVYIHFSEPVKNITNETVKLTLNNGPRQVLFEFFDSSGRPLVAGSENICILVAKPLEALKFNESYTLQVTGVRDVDEDLELVQGQGQTQSDTYQIDFKTRRTECLELDSLGKLPGFTSYRNFIFTAAGLDSGKGYAITISDTGNGNHVPRLLVEHLVQTPRAVSSMHLAFFTVEDFENVPGTVPLHVLESSELGDLATVPDDSLLAVLFRDKFGFDYLHIFHVLAGPQLFEIAKIPILGNGTPMALEKMGSILMVGFLNMAEQVKGVTRLYDMGKLAESYADLLAHQNGYSPIEFERLLYRLEVLDEFPVPGDVWDLHAFPRRYTDGIEFGFLVAAKQYPGVYRYLPDQRSPFLGVPMGDDPVYDARLIMKTAYPGPPETAPRPGQFSLFCGAAPNLTVWEQNQLKTIDVVIFSEHYRGANGYLYIYDLPMEASLDTHRDPKFSIAFPQGLMHFAVEPNEGLVAILGKDNTLSMMDLRALFQLETRSAFSAVDHPAIIMDAIPTTADRVYFANGSLFLTSPQGEFTQIPIIRPADTQFGIESFFKIVENETENSQKPPARRRRER